MSVPIGAKNSDNNLNLIQQFHCNNKKESWQKNLSVYHRKKLLNKKVGHRRKEQLLRKNTATFHYFLL